MAIESLPLFPLDCPIVEHKTSLPPTQAAYLAGLLDGEGYFGMHIKSVTSRGYRYKTFEYFIVLTMTDKAYMEGIAKMVPWGGGTVGRNARTLKGRAKAAYRMKWSMAACVSLCRAILPYIRLKKTHVQLILSIAEAKMRAQKQRRGQGHAYPAWIVQLQHEAVSQFRLLNQRGQDNASKIEITTEVGRR